MQIDIDIDILSVYQFGYIQLGWFCKLPISIAIQLLEKDSLVVKITSPKVFDYLYFQVIPNQVNT